MNNNKNPSVSVVISTRNRGDSVVTAIKSIIDNNYPYFELLVVDQSDNPETRNAVLPFLSNANFRYIPSTARGVSKGRNLGISHCGNELVLITDDDCEVPPNWIASMVEAFGTHPCIGTVFGNVTPGPYDLTTGFIPTYERKEPLLVRNIKQKNQARGIGACMGLRRSTWETIHGFDEMLGPGSKLKVGEEGDFAIKTLLAGFLVYETPAVSVVHHGFRTWQEGRELAQRNWFGIGAMLAKYFKCGKWFVFTLIGYEWGVIAVGSLISNIFTKHRLSGLIPVISFWRGFISGLFTPVDLNTGNYTETKFRMAK